MRAQADALLLAVAAPHIFVRAVGVGSSAPARLVTIQGQDGPRDVLTFEHLRRRRKSRKARAQDSAPTHISRMADRLSREHAEAQVLREQRERLARAGLLSFAD